MAYFSSGSVGSCFEEECYDCILGDKPCPIAWVQTEYNYEACNNDVASSILGYLVSNNGACKMKRSFPDTFNKKEG